jgi:Glycine zipper
VQEVTEQIEKESTMKRISTMSGIIALLVMLAGCADMSQTQQRALTGSFLGAAGGGLIGAAAGNAGMGAAIGAGLGGTGGFLLGRHNEAVDAAYRQGRADASKGQ